MANMQLPNDVVRTYSAYVGSKDAAGAFVPNPGAVYSAVAVPPVINVVVDQATGNATFNAVGPNTVGVAVTWSEAGGVAEASIVELWDVVDDLAPVALATNQAASFTDVPQAVPPQA